jgi:putative SOS response-associated peptidase YedK
LREPAQSRRTWTNHKSQFLRKFTKKTAGNKIGHPDQTPAFTPTTVTTPQCGHTVWGITGQVSEQKRRKTKPTNLPSQRARAHRRFNAHRCEKNMVTWFENAQNAMNKIAWLTRATGYLTGLTKHMSVLECKAVSMSPFLQPKMRRRRVDVW